MSLKSFISKIMLIKMLFDKARLWKNLGDVNGACYRLDPDKQCRRQDWFYHRAARNMARISELRREGK